MDVFAEVARTRHAVADQIDALAAEDVARFDVDSWCAGWRCHDVLGHLVHLAEATQWTMMRDLVRNGPSPDKALGGRARALGALPVPELTARLRAAANGRFHIIGSPAIVALGELFVHGSDLLRPLGEQVQADPAAVAAVLPAYRRIGSLAFHGAPARKVTLVATDIEHRLGDGPEVRGTALDLLLLLANRPQVLPALTGPGVELLRF